MEKYKLHTEHPHWCIRSQMWHKNF